jgi:hypothetical protein
MVTYIPIVHKGNDLVADSTLITKEHLDNLEHVLTVYGLGYIRVSEKEIKIHRKLWKNRDYLWNMTTKANDRIWLKLHPLTK